MSSLSKLIKSKGNDLQTKVMFGVPKHAEGISFKIRFLDRAEYQNLSNLCQKTEYDPATYQNVRKVDGTEMLKRIVDACLISWEQFTYRKLLALCPVDEDGLVADLKTSKRTLDDQIPFDKESAYSIFESSYSIGKWFMDSVMDITLFQADLSGLEKKLGNSSPSATGK